MGRQLWKRALRYFIAPTGMVLAGWQLKRHYWKHNLLSNLREAAEQDPLQLQDLNAEYNHRYLLKNAKIDGNCIRVGPKGMKFDGRVHFSDAFICPCVAPALGRFLIHLGWLSIKTEIPQLPKELELCAIREPDEPSGLFLRNIPEEGIWRVKDISQLSSTLHTQPVMLRALQPITEEVRVKKLDLGNIPNRHLEYVFTWSGLSMTALVFSFLL